MNKSLCLLLAIGLMATSVSGGEMPKKMLKAIAMNKIWESCWGKETMKDFYGKMKQSIKKCQGLTPTFDLGIFEDQKQYPFGSSPSSVPTGFDRNSNANANANVNLNNPYEAWMSFLAFQQAQKQGGRRFRRAVRTPTASEIAEFKMDVMEFKMEKMENLGNLTCVLADLGVLDANLNINLRYFTVDMWNDLKEQLDPAFKSKLIENFEDCHDIAQSIPQDVLDKHPVYKKLGRHMIFLKCQFKSELTLCAKQEISRYFEEKYGAVDTQMLRELGLPENKFDAAYMKKKVMYSQMAESEKFVYKFIMTGGKE